MRLIKVRIRKGDYAQGENQMVYPARYNPQEVDRLGHSSITLNPAFVSLSGEIGRGAEEEFCVIALPDALAEEYAQDPNMAIIDSSEADALMESWRVNNGAPLEMIKDPMRITAIRAKQEAGITLSQADLDALDPTKSENGINQTRKIVGESVKNINDDLASLPKDLKEIKEKN